MVAARDSLGNTIEDERRPQFQTLLLLTRNAIPSRLQDAVTRRYPWSRRRNMISSILSETGAANTCRLGGDGLPHPRFLHRWPEEMTRVIATPESTRLCRHSFPSSPCQICFLVNAKTRELIERSRGDCFYRALHSTAGNAMILACTSQLTAQRDGIHCRRRDASGGFIGA